MSKAVKAVTKAVGKVFGGGGSAGIAGTGRFQAKVRQVDKEAFKIKESEEAAKRARDLEKESADRSKQAQTDRRALIESLQAQAAGTAPSLAEAQLKSASDRSLAQQLAAAQSQRGGSAASRERQLMRGQAAAGRDLAQQSAEARIQERNMAQQLLGQQVSEEQQLSDQLTQNYLAQGFNIEQARQQALEDAEAIMSSQYSATQQANLQGHVSAAQQRGQLFQGAASGIGAAFGLSDKTAKTKIKKAKKSDFKSLAKAKEEEKMSKDEIKEHNKKQAKKGIELAKERRDSEAKEKRSKEFKKMLGDSKGLEAGGKAMGFALGKGLKSIFSDEKTKTKIKKADDSAGSEHSAKANVEKIDLPKPPKKDGGGLGDLAKMAPMAMAAMSDKDSKKNMKAYSDKRIKKDFLDKLEAYTYEYKNEFKDDPRAGHGRRTSVMAQDLEKAGPLGKAMVQEDEDGIKAVDYAKGYGAILAAQAHLNKRMDQLEKKKSKSKKRK